MLRFTINLDSNPYIYVGMCYTSAEIVVNEH